MLRRGARGEVGAGRPRGRTVLQYGLVVLAALGFLAALAQIDRETALPQRIIGAFRARISASETMGADDAARLSRWIRVVFDDAQTHWRRTFAAELRRSYSPGTLKLFTQSTATPCAEASGAIGPFYCARDQVVAFDLRFLHAVEQRLGADAATGIAMLVGQTVAVNAQHAIGIPRFQVARIASSGGDTLALALQADCLTGVWARRAAPELPGVGAELYGEVLAAERAVARGMGRAARLPQVTYDVISPGEVAVREAAFAIGFQAGRKSACPPPPPS